MHRKILFVSVDESLVLCIIFSIRSMRYQTWGTDINYKTFEGHLRELKRAQTERQNKCKNTFVRMG